MRSVLVSSKAAGADDFQGFCLIFFFHISAVVVVIKVNILKL